MKIQKGIVKYKDRNDIVCTYGTTDDNVNYYFLELGYDYKLPNGNIIASTELVEAIDSMYQASHVGVLGEDGSIVLPFTHKMIRLIDGNLILAELSAPISTSVLEANEMRKDPALATKLVSTSALIKERLNAKMQGKGKYLLNDQFSEATIYDLNGNNLLNGEYYSFIAEADGKLYLSKNTTEDEIKEFSILPAEVQNTVVDNSASKIDVSAVQVPTSVVENALENPTSVQNPEPEKFGEELLEESQNYESSINGSLPNQAVESTVSGAVEKLGTDSSVGNTETVLQSVPDSAEVPMQEVVPDSVEVPTQEAVSENVVSNEEDFLDRNSSIAEKTEETVPESPEEIISASSEESVSEENSAEAEEEEVEEPLKIAMEEENQGSSDNMIDEADEENVELDDTIEESTLDDLFHRASQYDTEEVEEEKEDPFKDFVVKTDEIEKTDDYDDRFNNHYSDSIVSDVAKYLNALLEQNRGLIEQNNKLIKQNDKLKDSLEKALASRNLLFDKSSMQDKKIDALKMKVSKLEKANREQERMIESQTQDRADLEKVLANVKDVLGEDTYSYGHSFYSVK